MNNPFLLFIAHLAIGVGSIMVLPWIVLYLAKAYWGELPEDQAEDLTDK